MKPNHKPTIYKLFPKYKQGASLKTGAPLTLFIWKGVFIFEMQALYNRGLPKETGLFTNVNAKWLRWATIIT